MKVARSGMLAVAAIAAGISSLIVPHRGMAAASPAATLTASSDVGTSSPDTLSTVTSTRLLNSARMAVQDSSLLPSPRSTIASTRVIDGPRVLVSLAGPGAGSDLVFDPLSGEVTPVAAGPDPANLWLKDFFPVAQGYVWKYHDANTSEKFQINCLGQQTIHGATTWKLERTRPWAPQNDYDYIEVGAQAIRLHYRHIVAQANQPNDLDLDPAAVFSDAKITMGKIYTTEPHQVNPATGNTTIWTSRVEALEPITVGAGTIQCLRIHLSIKDSKLGTKFAEVQMHYGYHTGLVRRNGQFFGVFFYEMLDSHNLPPQN